MILPAQYLWLEPVIIGAIIVFVLDFIGNLIAFGGRVTNALVTAFLFAVVFGALVYFGYGQIRLEVTSTPSSTAPAKR